jgi:hypothetical protein
LLEENGQVAGLELHSSNLLCHHPSYITHLCDVAVITDYIRLESELSFLHVKTTLSHRDRLRQVKLAICETRHQVASTRLEAIAGSDNPYSLIEVFGRGHLATRAGAAVYVTKCAPVSVSPRAVTNCTSEIPVQFNGTDLFVNPASYMLKTYAVPIKCTDIAPPRFKIGGRWYCLFENRGLSECHEPLNLPVSPVGVDEDDGEKWGLGRSIYSKEQLEAFHEFQMSVAVRAAYVADSSKLAFCRRGPGGEWGLGLGQHAQAVIVDLVGLSFIPLYRFLGPVSMIIILVLFFITILRLVLTVLFQVIVLGKAKGCGFYLFAALVGCVYQVVISPIKRADKKAQEMAKQVERGILDGAEDDEGGNDDNGAADRYPSLAEVRRREDQCLPWNSWRRCGFRGRDDAPRKSVLLEERRPLESGDAANAPSRE